LTPESDARLAARLAGEAGEVLLEIRARGFDDPRQLGREGDQRSNAFLLGELARLRPGDAVLSEEAVDDRRRLESDRVWIIDPLDGTREFGMPGRADWAVHVALWEAARGLTAAAVAQPAMGEVYASDEVASVSRAPRPDPVILVSDSRPPAFAGDVASLVGGQVRSMGSAGAKAMAVLRADADAYLHAGGQWEWDSAAPAGVLQAAAFHTSRIDGSALAYNQASPYIPDLLFCHPDLAAPLLDAIARVVA
jgi:3'(2'), 5'-bisphosphate nucleotidase